MNTYRVCFEHKAGHLVAKVVDAPSKLVAEALIRQEFPVVFGKLSSVTLQRPAAK